MKEEAITIEQGRRPGTERSWRREGGGLNGKEHRKKARRFLSMPMIVLLLLIQGLSNSLLT